MSMRCKLTGKRRNLGYNVSHAHNKTRKVQLPNLHKKRIWFAEQNRMVSVKLSARALRTVTRKGLDGFLRDEGLTLKDIL
ncbi:MAG: 50S ribosomal protein L28 [Bradymonadales bacterium]|nr:50S ribosomal protein L28 [Bradymonadales bacterium]